MPVSGQVGCSGEMDGTIIIDTAMCLCVQVFVAMVKRMSLNIFHSHDSYISVPVFGLVLAAVMKQTSLNIYHYDSSYSHVPVLGLVLVAVVKRTSLW